MLLYFVTSNENKLREAGKILGCQLRMIDLDIPEIQSLNVEEIVKHKAREAYRRVQHPVMVEDTGFYVAAWNGFPGPLIKWIMNTMGVVGLSRLLKYAVPRDVTVKACAGLCNGPETRTFTGVVEGTAADAPRGTGGFGWDPLFIPNGSSSTYAEMSPEEKNAISHRRKALLLMRDFLRQNSCFLSV